MKILKNVINEHKYELTLIDNQNNTFNIHYAGADLYWSMNNYFDGNEFTVAKEDNIFHDQLERLFCIIQKYDRYKNLLVNDHFEWISEAYGITEEAHKLTITKINDSFKIRFFQNKNNPFCLKDFCSICFCLSGSRNQEIANAFSSMFLEYKDNVKKKSKLLKK